MNTTTTSRQAAYDLAVKVIRQNGIKVRRNVQSCCRGCVTPEQMGMKSETDPIVWTFGGQGNATTWNYAGAMVYRNRRRGYGKTDIVDTLYFNHSNLTPELGALVIDTFRAHGFQAEWDGSEYSCIEVYPNRVAVAA